MIHTSLFFALSSKSAIDHIFCTIVDEQIALSRLTSVFATFGKNVINFAEVNFQRLGTMPTRVSEEDFTAYTSLIVTMCESCQVS